MAVSRVIVRCLMIRLIFKVFAKVVKRWDCWCGNHQFIAKLFVVLENFYEYCSIKNALIKKQDTWKSHHK